MMAGAVIAKIRCFRDMVNPEYIGWSMPLALYSENESTLYRVE